MNEQTCSQCGESIQPEAKFCPECGKALTASTPQSTGKSINDHLIMIAVLIAAAAIFTGYQMWNPDEQVARQESGMPSMGLMDMTGFEEELPEDFETLVKMGNAMMDQGQYQMAIACYDKALVEDPNATDVMVDLATCQHAFSLNDQAVVTFLKALDKKPEHQIAKFNLGIVYYTLGEDQKAKDWWTKLLAENPPQELKLRTQELMSKLGS